MMFDLWHLTNRPIFGVASAATMFYVNLLFVARWSDCKVLKTGSLSHESVLQ